MIILELFVFTDDFQVKCLLHLDISTHICDFTIPVVQLIPLHGVSLVFIGDCLLKFSELILVSFEVLFEVVDFILHSFFIGVKSSS